MENETLPEGSEPEVKVTEGEPAGGENVKDSLTLESINATLGKDFKDVETAMKSLKDTQSFVGKKMKKAEEVDPTLEDRMDNLQHELNNSNFYRKNPQYDNKETRELIAKLGGNPTEVVEDEVFKNVFEKTSAYDKSQESKSVLHNSSRLKQVSTKMDDAKTAMDKANDAASKGDVTEALAEKRQADADAVASVVESLSK